MLENKIVTEERSEDVRFDNMFTDFLQENVYPDMIAHGILDSAVIIPEDAREQFCGIDAVWTVNGEEFTVDHKTRSSLTNIPFKALTFETKTTDLTEASHPVHRGWFINKKLRSDYYLFSHITSAGDGKMTSEDITPENINDVVNEVKFNFCKKSEVVDFVESNVCPVDDLYGYTLECEKRFHAVNNGRKKYNLPPLKIRYSDGPFKPFEFEYKDAKGRNKTYSNICLVTSPKKETPTNLIIQEWQINALPSSRNFYWTKKDGLIEVNTK